VQSKTLKDCYKNFLDFVNRRAREQRKTFNKRMFYVFMWCFFAPVATIAIVLILIATDVLPYRLKNNFEWLILAFPITYSLYFFGSEVLMEVPRIFRKGAMAVALEHNLKDGKWRDEICLKLEKDLPFSTDQLKWVIENYKLDLKLMRYRIRHITILGGAVFYGVLRGLDSLSLEREAIFHQLNKTSVLAWVQIINYEISQILGLSIFLILFYLAGMQNLQTLERYLDCAELSLLKKK